MMEDWWRLLRWGWFTTPLDLHWDFVLTEEQRKALEDKYLPDLLIWLNDNPIAYFETLHRSEGRDNKYFIQYTHKLARYQRLKITTGRPVYISVWMEGEWQGYVEIDDLEVIHQNKEYTVVSKKCLTKKRLKTIAFKPAERPLE